MNVFLALGHRQVGCEFGLLLLGDLLRLLGRHLAEFEEFLEVALVDAGPLLDHPIQGWLRKRRLVGLVVATTPKAVHIDHDVPLKLSAEIRRQVHDLGHGLRILAVDVEDRDLKHLGDIGRIDAAA